ncbi:hypothetical protein Saso_48830 [Streptomyces asoensis]|uniref:Uncharacterized protein n=1 Tax=Streptomyces asoensis TaxID=249586 RepID=A0ABQ3S537_9ACTN|nr:hypothetical protein GCM10010496_30860 [Streptomyces asoensis]GHI63233.1 hypothetical protein Saso_48830 [Streptomyces asoensis]
MVDVRTAPGSRRAPDLLRERLARWLDVVTHPVGDDQDSDQPTDVPRLSLACLPTRGESPTTPAPDSLTCAIARFPEADTPVRARHVPIRHVAEVTQRRLPQQ